jgi:hypothetical protein
MAFQGMPGEYCRPRQKFIDMKVDYAVRQINQLLAAKSASAAR